MDFKVSFSEPMVATMEVGFSETDRTLDSDFGEIQVVVVGKPDVYDGEYRVIPKISAQTLDTANKLMQSDVVVEKIPYAEVSNNSGGKTASIG